MATDIRKPLRKILPHLIKAREENLNEADTCARICEVFEQVLDYDPLEHISREVQIKDGYADFGVKLEKGLKFLVEAKSAATELKDRHIGQAERYASQGNIEWVLLTNGITWQLYHLSFGEGIESELAFSLDVTAEDFDAAASQLALLHRREIQKGSLEDLWSHRTALSPESIAKSLFTDENLGRIRRDIRKREGLLVSVDGLGRAIHDMLSVEVRERIGPLRIRKKRRAREKEDDSMGASDSASAPAVPTTSTAPASADVAPLAGIAVKKGNS
jgi:hypothetical protein